MSDVAESPGIIEAVDIERHVGTAGTYFSAEILLSFLDHECSMGCAVVRAGRCGQWEAWITTFDEATPEPNAMVRIPGELEANVVNVVLARASGAALSREPSGTLLSAGERD